MISYEIKENELLSNKGELCHSFIVKRNGENQFQLPNGAFRICPFVSFITLLFTLNFLNLSAKLIKFLNLQR